MSLTTARVSEQNPTSRDASVTAKAEGTEQSHNTGASTMQTLTREQIISARDRARTKLGRQRQALQATEAELALWDEHLEQLDKPAAKK